MAQERSRRPEVRGSARLLRGSAREMPVYARQILTRPSSGWPQGPPPASTSRCQTWKSSGRPAQREPWRV